MGLGVWMSPDPVTIHEIRSDQNPYAYVMGRPLVAVDPDGREIFTAIAIGVAVGAVIAGGTSAIVQYATTGSVDWGWSGVGGAALAGGVAGGVGFGMGAALGGGLVGTSLSGVSAGAAGGATNAAATSNNILVGAGVGALSGLAGALVGYGTIDWGWFASSTASAASSTSVGLGVQALDGGVTLEEAGTSFASGVGSGLASAGTMRAFQGPPSDNVLERVGKGNNLYKLSD